MRLLHGVYPERGHKRFFAEFTLSQWQRFFTSFRMTGEGFRMTSMAFPSLRHSLPGERVGHSSPQQSWGVFWNILIKQLPIPQTCPITFIDNFFPHSTAAHLGESCLIPGLAIPFARLPSGMPGRDPGVEGGMPHGWQHGEDDGVRQGYGRDKF